jgi:hypothetical protein
MPGDGESGHSLDVVDQGGRGGGLVLDDQDLDDDAPPA